MASKADPNLVLTGFMGTGKTTVGKLLAEQWQRTFADTDQIIQQQMQLTIPEIFEQYGEPFFRKREAEICVDLAAQVGLVIATGGGALLNRDTVAAMTATGMVICLTASEQAIAARLQGETAARPLANGWRDLLQQRQPYYAALPYHLDTTDKPPQQITQEVSALWHSVFE